MSASSVVDPELDKKIASAVALVREELGRARESAQRACLTNSFQAEDMVVLDMVRQSAPAIPVLFLDTGYHFKETCEYRDRMAAAWQMNLKNIVPVQSVGEQEAEFGLLYKTDPSRCCALRKVGPLFRALEDYDVWFTGLRREQARTRARLQPVEVFTLPTGRRLRKLSPLADWSTRDVWRYAERNAIPLLSLYDRGYTSIGCAPCTSLPTGDDPRSGRWGGRKTECGIHIQPAVTSEGD